MFSSNQILQISGDLNHENELKNALEFALNLDNTRLESIVYQITEDRRYCIGWYYENIPDGWTKFQFDFNSEIVAKIIAQHLEKFPKEEGFWDGSYSKGFLMKIIDESLANESNGIKNPFYGIVSFEPYTCFYSK